MKLTEISLDGYKTCNNLRLIGLGSLNLVYGPPGSGKSTLAEYVRNVLFGFEGVSPSGHGALEAVIDGLPCRLSRTLESNRKLFVSDLQGTSADRFCEEAIRTMLDAIGPDVFDTAFCVDGRRSGPAITDLCRLVHQRFETSVVSSAVGNFVPANSYSRFDQREEEVALLSGRITRLENEARLLADQIHEGNNELQRRQAETDDELQKLQGEIEGLEFNTLRRRIDELDRNISELRIRLEREAENVDYVSRPHPHSNGLSVLYQRLDEVDNQIRRWRHVHCDVQKQRVQLKDEMVAWNEMTLESDGHPYFRARKILTSIEAKVGLAEKSLGRPGPAPIGDADTAPFSADQLVDLCGQIRGDLYALCDELSGQYKSIRHRSGAAELKRLRRCYDEIGENIEFLVETRCQVVREIRQADPEGAAAIERSENEFCQCAQHHGYLQARRRFVGDPPTGESSLAVVPVDYSASQMRLKELEDQRSAVVRQLVVAENRSSELKERRRSLIEQSQRLVGSGRLDELRFRLENVESELAELRRQKNALSTEVKRDRRVQGLSSHPVLSSAADLVQRLTCGEIRRIWLTSEFNPRESEYGVGVENLRGDRLSSADLRMSTRQQLGLSLSLAVVQFLNHHGKTLPVILDHVFENLNSEQIRATLGVISDLCDRGLQVIAMTSDPSAVQIARQLKATVFDLPETSVSPAGPSWLPERSTLTPPGPPEFLTPFTTRRHTSIPDSVACYPLVKYPPAGPMIDHSIENFERYPAPFVAEQSVAPAMLIEDSTELNRIGTLDSSDLDRLARLGITRVETLLAINPNELTVEFPDAQVSSAQIDDWQAQIWLMQCIPGLPAADAQILVASGIREPEQLESSNSEQILERIHRYLTITDGRPKAGSSRNYDQDRVNGWYESLNRTRFKYRLPSGYSRQNRWIQSGRNRRQHDGSETERSVNRDRRAGIDRRNRIRPHSQASQPPAKAFVPTPFAASNNRESSPSPPAKPTRLKFHLDLSSDLEAAPSIGPKTAERFSKININTVGEFLAQTAESMATRINYKRITADVIRQWQHQARLVCRVPNLRGHDAQLLVACGIIEPEDLAEKNPQQLFEVVAPFSETKEGLKIIRGGKKPDAEEVANWVNWARQTRSLQAA